MEIQRELKTTRQPVIGDRGETYRLSLILSEDLSALRRDRGKRERDGSQARLNHHGFTDWTQNTQGHGEAERGEKVQRLCHDEGVQVLLDSRL